MRAFISTRRVIYDFLINFISAPFHNRSAAVMIHAGTHSKRWSSGAEMKLQLRMRFSACRSPFPIEFQRNLSTQWSKTFVRRRRRHHHKNDHHPNETREDNCQRDGFHQENPFWLTSRPVARAEGGKRKIFLLNEKRGVKGRKTIKWKEI